MARRKFLVHFVGFRDDRYWNAVKVFGPPDMIHRDWDYYAAGDVIAGDTVIFADGDWRRTPRSFSAEAQTSRERRRQRRSGTSHRGAR
ncbi:hypothetical protein [Qipengyuania atrilutea]|uniref:Uncharacterized protein n=1 Tax=Qipengyuania atrilutea TaxID=2744473 RepID=A0A850HCZ5_9SPHN|nr:hypothetical protein [Actirhodobacter atriluteus]NVD44989.1 hypothetical protein [Actirhodobacter atriluteus]